MHLCRNGCLILMYAAVLCFKLRKTLCQGIQNGGRQVSRRVKKSDGGQTPSRQIGQNIRPSLPRHLKYAVYRRSSDFDGTKILPRFGSWKFVAPNFFVGEARIDRKTDPFQKWAQDRRTKAAHQTERIWSPPDYLSTLSVWQRGMLKWQKKIL